MKRQRQRLGLPAVAVAMAAGLSCGPAPNLLPINDLNRPTDVAFMCFGAFAEPAPGSDGGVPDAGASSALEVTGRPMRACHPPGQYDPGATTTTRTFAFMPNSAAGTLSAVDADHWKLVDLDPDTGGYGTAPLGQDPEQISVSDDGCRIISANRGSCDLTLVDPSILVAPMLNTENGGRVDLASRPLRTYAQTFRPIKGDGTTLIASPYEAVFLPQDTSGLLTEPAAGSSLPLLPTQNALCGDTPTVDPAGWPVSTGTKSWYVLVTYPSCDLVAMVALPSGRIVSSAHVVEDASDPTNPTVRLEDAGTSPVCPVTASCGGQALSPKAIAAVADGAVADGAPKVAAPGDAAPPDAGAGVAPDAGAGATGAAGAGGSSGSPDSGAPGGTLGNQFTDNAYVELPISPSGIAIVPGGGRAYVSLANASYVLSIGLSSGGLTLPANAVYLHEGARGSSRIRLNVDRTRYSSNPGIAGVYVGAEPASTPPEGDDPTANFVGFKSSGDRRYLYAIARDGTLRVISVNLPGAEVECENNLDPLNLPAGVSTSTACVPVSPAERVHRRPFSVGPGIHFPSLPTDVAAADIQRYPIDATEQSVTGAHAWVVTDSGIVYLVNLNPVLRNYTGVIDKSGTFVSGIGPPTEPPPFVNTLRDRNEISYSLTLDPSSGPPRVDVLPAEPATGPYLEPFWTQGSILNATALSGSYVQTVLFFPQEPTSPTAPNKYDPIDRRAITPQIWTVSWEGPLGGLRNTGNAVPQGNLSAFTASVAGVPADDGNSVFEDGGANYCQQGVVPGDLLTLSGCTTDAQCGIGEECILGDGISTVAAGLSVTGLCVDPNRSSLQQDACAEFLNSVRRYYVAAASPTALVIRPNLDEIVISPLKPPCHPAPPHPDGGAPVDAGGADGGVGADVDSCPDTADDPTTANFTCESSYPGGGSGPRCLMLCQTDNDCRPGRVCVDFENGKTAGPLSEQDLKPKGSNACTTGTRCFCADAPVFDEGAKACFDQLISYQMNVGRSFIVAGSQSPLVTTATLPPPNGNCAPDPTPDARFSFRIPMTAPVCSNVGSGVAAIDSRIDPDFVTGAANQTAVTNAQALVTAVTSTPGPKDPCLYLGGPAAADPTDSTATHVRALFENSQLSFVLANLDRSPTTQFSTSIQVSGGFGAQVVQSPTTVEVSMPARIILGPVDSLAQVTTGTAVAPASEAPYLFVVDQRRLGLEQGGGPTRGQLLRINPFGFQSTVGSAPTGYQPIFEDYTASGGLFPIQ